MTPPYALLLALLAIPAAALDYVQGWDEGKRIVASESTGSAR
jgi:hypothetical protein